MVEYDEAAAEVGLANKSELLIKTINQITRFVLMTESIRRCPRVMYDIARKLDYCNVLDAAASRGPSVCGCPLSEIIN